MRIGSRAANAEANTPGPLTPLTPPTTRQPHPLPSLRSRPSLRGLPSLPGLPGIGTAFKPVLDRLPALRKKLLNPRP